MKAKSVKLVTVPLPWCEYMRGRSGGRVGAGDGPDIK